MKVRAMSRPQEFLYVNAREGQGRGLFGEPAVPPMVEIVVPHSRTGFIGRVALPVREAEEVREALRTVIDTVQEFQRDQEITIQEEKSDGSG